MLPTGPACPSTVKLVIDTSCVQMIDYLIYDHWCCALVSVDGLVLNWNACLRLNSRDNDEVEHRHHDVVYSCLLCVGYHYWMRGRARIHSVFAFLCTIPFLRAFEPSQIQAWLGASIRSREQVNIRILVLSLHKTCLF